MTIRLYDIPLEAEQIEEQLHENLGELTPDLEKRIAEFLSQGKAKIESAAIVVRSLLEDADVCRKEAHRLVERAGRLEASGDRLKNLILFAVDQGFSGKVKTAKFTIWGQTSAPLASFDLAPGVDINELMAFHPQFVRAPEPELNKVALKEAFKAGVIIPEEIVIEQREGTRYLRIK